MIGVLGAHFVQNIHNKSSYETFHFIFSKNVKIGIRCSIVIPDSPQETPLEIMEFFYVLTFLKSLSDKMVNSQDYAMRPFSSKFVL